MIRALTLALLVALVPATSRALESPMNAGELAHALDRVASTGRVLYVAAHPDDENTRLLAYLAGARHVRAAYLSMTRGGGGQNLIGTEQGELLDVVRTEELLAARRLDGAHQFFTRMRDFGYSKSADETFAIWDKERALADVVRVIRAYQPDVIVTRFNEEPPNHGHHTASAILAREAFAAAADPARFPEAGPAWKVTRLVHNHSHWRGPPPAGALKLDVGAYDPRSGLGYAEVAALSRSQHKSQGFGASGERGQLLEHFTHVAGAEAGKDLLEGVELGWKRFGAAGERVGKALERARSLLGRDDPSRAVPALLDAHAALAALPDVPRVRDAREELEAIVAEASGLFLRATAPAPEAVPGAEVEVQLEAVSRLGADVTLERVSIGGDVLATGEKLARNEKKLIKRKVHVPADAAVSAPYWLAQAAERGSYAVADPSLIGAPRGPAALSALVEVSIGGRALRLHTPVVHAWTDRVHGERVRPFLVVPPATVTPVREAALPTNGKAAPVLLRVRAGGHDVKGDVSLGLPAGWKATPAVHAVELSRPGDEITVRFDVVAPPGARAVDVRPSIVVGGRTWSFREDVIDYPHIPLQVVLQPSTLRLSPLEITLPAGLLGYVQGSGDSIADDLAHVGARVELLDDEALRSGDLSRYHAIVLGIRAYNTRAAVRAAHGRLMDYVERGGTVLVQYNTTSPWEPLSTPIGPYPIEIGRERVTNEAAEMLAVRAEHPLLRAPNRITSADFDGWVQERGLYFAAKWDERYEPLFRAADPGEEPLAGGTLVAKHGKGRYVYSGLAFFRQLRAGVPGAYRLFVNLVAGK